jgi:ABC-2 type transport system permease protein
MRGQNVKNTSILRSLSSKKFRHGGYAALLIVAALAVVIAVNLLVDQIPWKLDMTENQLFSLSEQSKQILRDLKTDVNLTLLSKAGQENLVVTETLVKYAQASPHIKFKTIDPDRNPTWAKPYEKEGASLSDGGVVVAGMDGKRFKAIQYYDMYNWDYSDQSQEPQVSSLAIEQKLTTAILYVTADRNPAIYVLTGHNEEKLADYAVSAAVESQNYDTKDLLLLSMKAVPADADIVVVLDPKVDISTDDSSKLLAYLQTGGRLFIMKNPSSTPSTSFANLDSLLSSYGIAIRQLLVVEGNTDYVYLNNPLSFIPKQETHDILAPITKANYPILFFASGAIETLPLKKKTLTVSPLLSTSLNSYGMVDYTVRDSLAKKKTDIEGPFTLAAAVSDKPADPNAKETRLVAVASTAFLLQELTSQTPGNSDFFLNSLSWLRDKKDTISIQAKSLMTFRLRMNETQSLLISGICALLIPLLILGAGLFVWIRRRHL